MINQPKIVIIDYGVGNLHSLSRAFNYFNIKPVISEDAKIIEEADGVILPGVGSFQAGMRGLELRGLTETVKKIARGNKPILGICLGAQLLLTKGHEFGVFNGLDIIKGEVVKFSDLEKGEKIPQIGWNKIYPLDKNKWAGTILNSVKENDQVYFVHSYILKPDLEENVLSATIYGGRKFCSSVKQGNVYGCQFHPEKSGPVGLKIIENFINIVKYGKN